MKMEHEIHKTRLQLKTKILRNDTFHGYENEYKQVLDLLKKTIEISESNSALLIGPRAAGKTTVSLRIYTKKMKLMFFSV